jgi:hypothetical protein
VDWLYILAWAALLLGIAAAGFIYARHPSFWVLFGAALFQKFWPQIWALVSTLARRKSAEDEAAWRREQLTKPTSQPMPSKFRKRER